MWIAQTWHYTTDDPGQSWTDTDFVDAAWESGPGGFGSGTPENAHIKTDWSTGQIWLCASFTPPDIAVQSVVLSLYHDEDIQIFLNGRPVFQEASFIIDYEEPALSDDFKAALKPGKNVLAITCLNTDGPGYVDAGLAVLADFGATPDFHVGTDWTFPDIWLRTPPGEAPPVGHRGPKERS